MVRKGHGRGQHTVVSQQAAWPRAEATWWYGEGRLRALSTLADRTRNLRWSAALLCALLEELHTDDAFSELVRNPRTTASRRWPQLLFLALAIRHSWRPDDLSRLARRLGIRASGPLPTPHTRSGARNSDVRAFAREHHPGHHEPDSATRRRPVKALRSASTPRGGASGLDAAVGLAGKRPLRNAPGIHPPKTRRTCDRKGDNHA